MSSVAIFAVSFGLLVDEIMLSAIFHVLLGAGNTVAAIAIALVGLSASGVVAYAVPAFHRPERAGALRAILLFGFSLALIASPFLLMRIPLSHGDLVHARGDLAPQLWRLLVYHIAVLPFFLGGLTISLLLRSNAANVSRLYFSDLVGAALGCLASPLLLSLTGAPSAILWGAAPATALAVGLGAERRALPRPLLLMLGLLLPVALTVGPGSFVTLNTMGPVDAPSYRSFRIEGGDIEYEKWALDAWTIIRSERIPQQWESFEGWGLSRNHRGPVPRTRLVNYNARFSTYATEYDGDLAALGDWLDADLGALHQLLGRRYPSVLNIGAGGGREVLSALHHGAERVVAVDVSDVVVNDIMKRELLEFSGGLFLDPRVTAMAAEGRNFAERSQERFDLIEFSIVGGMNLEKMDLVRVDDLFTQEALRTYVERLSGGGVFSYLMYTTRSDLVAEMAARRRPDVQPYIPALRTLTGLRIALEEAVPDLRFSDHVLVAALPRVIHPRYDLVHIVASPTPFSGAERQAFLQRCRALDFEVFHPQDSEHAARNSYAQLIQTDDLERFAARLPFSIWPPTDDQPFQYALDLGHVREALLSGSLLALLSGTPLLSVGASTGLLAALVMLVPLLLVRARGGTAQVSLRRGGILLGYFACIGFAYMAVEIAALLRLQAYLGKPIYGLSVALFAFLLSSGLGSYATARVPEKHLSRTAGWVVVSIVMIGLAFLALSGPLFAATIPFEVTWRAGIAVAAIFPLALPMGMLFPIGVKLIARESEDLIPWAWAANGCASVLGIFGTRIAALFVGFSRGLLLGLLVYLLVLVCLAAHARLQASPAARG